MVLDAIGFRLAVEPKAAAHSRPKGAVSKLVLHTSTAQVKEPTPKYALAADTEARTKSTISLRTSDDKEVGTLDFDYKDGALILQITGEMSLKRVQDAEIQTRDGKIFTGDISVRGKDRLVLLRKKKVFPEHISQITFSLAE